VLLLAGHFLKMFRATMNKNVTGITPAARQKLLLHIRWPGNVRELRNAIERALILETLRNPAGQPAGFPGRNAFAKNHGPTGRRRGIARRRAGAAGMRADHPGNGTKRLQPHAHGRPA
jgi:DNA-binding NtrC family response regulator